MKILDRYVLIAFLKNYVISLVVLVGLYVVLDMVFNFDDLASVPDKANVGALAGMLKVMRDIADYYFYQAFFIFVTMSGIIPVVAASFTLMRLSRFNELTALLSAGVPLLRVTLPIIIASLMLNGLLLIDQELILPRMIPKLIRKHEDIHTGGSRYFMIRGMQDADKSLLMAARYHPPKPNEPAHMEEVDVIERDAALEPVAHTYAKGATWDAESSQWILTDGWRVTGLRADQRRSAELPAHAYKSNITPEEISLYRSSGYIDLLPTARINELIARPQSYGTKDLLRVKHLRFTQPIMNIILLLLAIPTVLNHDPKELKTAAMKCLFLVGQAMGCIFMTQQLAGNSPGGEFWATTWPALMAWVPIFSFGPLAVYLLDRVRT